MDLINYIKILCLLSSIILHANCQINSSCDVGFSLFKKFNVSIISVYCIDFQPNHNISVFGVGGWKYYLKDLKKFATHISYHVSYLGVAFAIVEDNSTIPIQLSNSLSLIKQPFLSHSQLKALGTVILIPDFHFIRTRGFESVIQTLEKTSKRFYFRSSKVFWRGSTTGLKDNCWNLPRVQVSQLAKHIDWCNIKIVKVRGKLVQSCDDKAMLNLKQFKSNGLIGSYSREELWASHKGILDIDGNVNAWGLFWRLHSGSVVFKVESEYTSFVLHKMVAWKHYIPLTANFSDFEEKTKLVTLTDDISMRKLEGIRNNAKKLAQEITYEKEVLRVANELSIAWI